MHAKRYTVDEVSHELKVSKRTILREIKRGKLRVEKVGRRYLIPEDSLKKYLGHFELNLEAQIESFISGKKSEMVTLLQKLISLPSESNSDNEAKLARYLKKKLEDFGIRTVLYKDKDALAVRATYGYADAGLLLDCPLDTTPAGDLNKWTFPPYEGFVKSGRMYGRGTADSKAGIVAMIYSLLALKKFVPEDKIRVELVFDGGEQTGEYSGIKLAIKKGLPVKAGIIGYAGEGNDIGIGCRGYHRFKLTSYGHSVHTGARYKAGVNAIVNMAALITEMEHIRLPKSKIKYFDFGSKLTFPMIAGGRAINIVPDECEAYLDVRTVPELKKKKVETILKRIIRSIELKYKGFDIKYNYLVGQEGYVLTDNEPVILALKEAVHGVTGRNSRFVVYGPAHIGTLLYEEGIPIVVWGPNGGNIHSYDEYVELDSIPKTSLVYTQMVLNYFGID